MKQIDEQFERDLMEVLKQYKEALRTDQTAGFERYFVQSWLHMHMLFTEYVGSYCIYTMFQRAVLLWDEEDQIST